MLEAIISVLVAGAGLSAASLLTEAGKDIYNQLHAAISQKTSASDVQALEQDPKSQGRQLILRESLAKLSESEQEQLAQLAAQLNELLQNNKTAQKSLKIDYDGTEIAGSLRANNNVVRNSMTVQARNSKIEGDVEISGNTVGGSSEPSIKRV